MVQVTSTNPPPTPLANTNTSDTSMPDAATTRRKPKTTLQEKEKEAHMLNQTTFRKLPWSYFHLTLISASFSTTPASASAPDLSSLLISPLLTSALRAYLGTMGAAIPIDILKIAGRHVWIRVPRQDARVVQAALSSWVGSIEGEDVGEERGRVGVMWRVGGQNGVLGMIGGDDGSHLFG